jgi:hypothetical protein
MKRILLIIILTFICSFAHSQKCFWAKSSGSKQEDVGNAITMDVNGDVYVTASFQEGSKAGNQQFISDLLYTICQARASGRINTPWNVNCITTFRDISVNSNTSLSNIFSNDLHFGMNEGTVPFPTFIFPCPAENTINIACHASSEIDLLNMDGKVLKYLSMVNDNTSIDISDLAKGLYFIKLLDEQGIFVKRIIKK